MRVRSTLRSNSTKVSQPGLNDVETDRIHADAQKDEIVKSSAMQKLKEECKSRR